MNNPTFAFLLCVNRLDSFLPKAIDSVLQQSDSDFVFYIIANNCTDDLWCFLESIQDVRIRIYRTHVGQLCFNLNFGLNHIQEDYIIRFDADDICYSNRLAETKKYLMQHNYPDVLSGSVDYIDEAGNVSVAEGGELSSKQIRASLWKKNPLCHPATVIKRSTLLSVGGYSWGFNSEDYDLWTRLARNNNIRFVKVPQKMIQYRISEQQSRGRLLPYAEVSGIMIREFLVGKKFCYFMGFWLSIAKAIIRPHKG